jgi:hypothetical protein
MSADQGPKRHSERLNVDALRYRLCRGQSEALRSEHVLDGPDSPLTLGQRKVAYSQLSVLEAATVLQAATGRRTSAYRNPLDAVVYLYGALWPR